MTEMMMEGAFEGSRCVAAPNGYYAPATIRRVNEDGTFTLEFDEHKALAQHWYGVSAEEISFDDESCVAGILGLLGDNTGLRMAGLARALEALGYGATPEQVRDYWTRRCSELFGLGEDALLDSHQAFELLSKGGMSARQLAAALAPGGRSGRYFKVYWNQIRMGGREPSELARTIEMEDTFAALGLKEGRADATMPTLAVQGVILPAALTRFMGQDGIAEAVRGCHPSDPALVAPSAWQIERGLRAEGLLGEFGVVMVGSHQREREWVAVFDDAAKDARVYVRWTEERAGGAAWAWRLTAPSIAMFFWDLAQTGLCWYHTTGFRGGKPVRRTDVGLALMR